MTPPKGLMKTIDKKIFSFVDDEDKFALREIEDEVALVVVKVVEDVVVIVVEDVVVIVVEDVVVIVVEDVVVIVVEDGVIKVFESVVVNGKGVVLLFFFFSFCSENVDTKFIFNLKL
jgi:hypothetical protein